MSSKAGIPPAIVAMDHGLLKLPLPDDEPLVATYQVHWLAGPGVGVAVGAVVGAAVGVEHGTCRRVIVSSGFVGPDEDCALAETQSKINKTNGLINLISVTHNCQSLDAVLEFVAHCFCSAPRLCA